MISLPEHLSRDLRKQLSSLTQLSNLRELIAGVSGLIRGELGASEVVSSVAFETEEGNKRENQIVAWDVNQDSVSDAQKNILSESWIESSLHQRFLKLSESELNAHSYSVFSWPFPSAELIAESESGAGTMGYNLEVPKEFSLFLPLSSRFVCQSKCDLKFSGYCVAFFDTFPASPENFAHLIIQLPLVLSDILNAHQRDLRETFFFSGVLSHELKRGALGLINRLDGNATTPSTLELALANAKRLSKSLDSLFLLEKYFAKRFRVSTMKLSPSRELEELLIDAKALASVHNKTLNVSTELESKQINFDPSLLQHALINVLENAFKYSSSESVQLGVFEEQAKLRIMIEDGGPAISEEEGRLIFSMGYRSEEDSEKTGRGLGLFLVKLIFDYHDASIRVEQTASGGNRFVIEIPYANP